MVKLRWLAFWAVWMLAGCTTVSTDVIPLAPSLNLPPSQNVQILLEKPQRPYRELALIESTGMVGDSEIKLWRDAVSKAQALGADALVRLEVDKTIQPPLVTYDPFLDPFYSPFYPHGFFYPYHPFPGYRVIPGGVEYTLKTLAIKFQPVEEAHKTQP